MEAIVLKKNLFSESSEIITFYTREMGKVRAVARSVKNAKSKLAFGLETLFCTDLELVYSKKLHLVKGARPLNTYKDLRNDLEKVYLAVHANEIILKATPDEQSNPELYDLFRSFLEYLDQTPEQREYYSMDVFTLKAMAAIGYKPEFRICAVCGKNIENTFNSQNEEQVFFSNHKGGVLCAQDAQRSADAKMLNTEIYRFLLTVDTMNFAAADQQELPADQLHSLAESFAQYVLERDLKSGQYLV